MRLPVFFVLSAIICTAIFSEEIKAANVDITVSPETSRLLPDEELMVTVNVSVPDTDLTVVESVYYQWEGAYGGDMTTELKDNAGTASITGLRANEPGTKQLDIIVKTTDGLKTMSSYNYVFDDIVPVVSLEPAEDPASPNKTHSVTVNLDGNDTADRYFLSYYWSDVELDLIANPDAIDDWKDEGEQSLSAFDPPTFDSPVEAEGEWYFYVKVTDEAGNETIQNAGPFLLDNTPPVLTLINERAPACSIEEYDDFGMSVPCETAEAYPDPISPFYLDLEVDGKKRDQLAGYTFRYLVGTEPGFYWDGFEHWTVQEDNGRFQVGGYLYSEPVHERYVQLSIEDPAGNFSYYLTDKFTIDPAYETNLVVYPQDGFMYINESTLDVEVYVKKGDSVINSLEIDYRLYTWDDYDLDENFITTEVTGFNLVEEHKFFTDYYLANITLDLSGWELEEGIEFGLDVDYTDPASGKLYHASAPRFYYDVTAPVITDIIYDPPKVPGSFHDGTVTAAVYYSDDMKLPGGGKTAVAEYVFTANGTKNITLEDDAGNTVSETLTVDWIKTDYTVSYSPMQGTWTNQAVTATIAFEGDAQVTFEDMDEPVNQREYVITENGSYTLGYVDGVNAAGEVVLVVDWIDTTPPSGTLFYKIDESVKGVTATLVASDDSGEDLILTDAEGNEIEGEWTYTFTSNGTYTFYFKDPAGNLSSVTAEVNNFDNTPPELSIQYSTLDLTNTSVRATVKANEPITVTNNNGSIYYEFVENGTFTFQVEDRFGNASEITAEVSHIDIDPPVPVITYSTMETTKDNVVATISVESGEDFSVLNNYGRKSYAFTENGSFTFVISDPAGNRVEAIATVDNIDKSKVSYTLTYSKEELTANDVVVTVVPESGKTLTFPENDGSSSVTFEENGIKWLLAVDDLGNEYWIQLMVQWIDKKAPKIEIDRKYIVPQNGTVPDLMEGVTVTDNFGDYTIIHAEDIELSTIGEYEVTYTATDTVGNTSSAVRIVEVVDASELTIYVNGQLAEASMNIQADSIQIDVVGTMGQWELQGTYGNHKISRFKSGGYILDPEQQVAVTSQGYYTLLVRDQELQQKMIHLYITPLSSWEE